MNNLPQKVLLICNHFAPDNTIAAVRTTKLAKYLINSGYEVMVISENKHEKDIDTILLSDIEGISVIRAENSKKVTNFINRYKEVISAVKDKRFDDLNNRVRVNPKTGKKEFYTFQAAYPFIASLDYITELIRQYDLFINIKRNLDNYSDVDYLFTSYGSFFSFYSGRYLNKKNKKVPWIFDIRDSICRYKFTPKYMKWYALKSGKYVWKKADCITGVSKGICERIPEKYRNKVHLVTNGYDLSDKKYISVEKNADELVFTYTGSMYGGLQDLSPFFLCLSEVIGDIPSLKDKLKLSYAGNALAYEVFKSQAEKYGLASYCCYQGKLERKDSLKLQAESDVLLVAAFDYSTGKLGTITGKALEYMMAEKPIIAVINGDLKENELAKIIRKGNLGFAYEESNSEYDLPKIKEYLRKILCEYNESGKISFNADNEYLKKFDYQNISKELIDIFKRLK